MKQKQIKDSAYKFAVSNNYWATVGSGSNKTSADEIRIKLSELCYKTISSDFIEDKKHIDLSSEPLIIVCAAGTRESVLGEEATALNLSVVEHVPTNEVAKEFRNLLTEIYEKIENWDNENISKFDHMNNNNYKNTGLPDRPIL